MEESCCKDLILLITVTYYLKLKIYTINPEATTKMTEAQLISQQR